MKKIERYIPLIVIIVVFVLLCIFDINKIEDKLVFLTTLKTNIKWIEHIIKEYPHFLGLVFIVIVIICIKNSLSKKYSFEIKGGSFAGIDFSLKNPDEIVKNNIRNFLNTKRSLFAIDEQKENFSEVFDSYYEIYSFLRNQMGQYEKNKNTTSDTYKEINKMIELLNKFLTSYQSNFRRWFKIEENNQLNIGKYKPLFETQKEYPNYEEMICGFKNINNKMKESADFFKIDISKWEKEKK